MVTQFLDIDYGSLSHSTSSSMPPKKRIRQLEQETKFFRAGVRLEGMRMVTECTAIIDLILKEEEVRMKDENIHLPFAPGRSDDAFNKTIRDKVVEHVDILGITEGNRIFHPPHNKDVLFTLDYEKIFEGNGEYYLHLIVSGHEITSSEQWLLFKWTGNWLTAEMITVETDPLNKF